MWASKIKASGGAAGEGEEEWCGGWLLLMAGWFLCVVWWVGLFFVRSCVMGERGENDENDDAVSNHKEKQEAKGVV
jgi:hypothetical protein